MIPKIIHQTAKSNDLTWEESRLVKRLRTMLPGWEYRLWSDDDNAQLVAEQFPHYSRAFDSIVYGVAKSDIARYVYMHAFGGFYLDTDYKLLRPLDDQLRLVDCLIPLEGADPQDEPATPDYLSLGNAIMGSAPGHRFWHALITHIFDTKKPEKLNRSERIIQTTGPEVLTRFYLEHAGEFGDITLPEKNLFYPSMRWLGTRTSAAVDTYGVHLHWGSWRSKTLNIAARTLVRRKLNGLLS